MRRSRFAKTMETPETPERPSIGDALRFDIASPATSDEEALCEWRLTGVEHAPLILCVTHLLIAVACAVLTAEHHYSTAADMPLLPSALAVLLDLCATALMMTRKRLSFEPHTIFRILCGYLAVTGALWTWFGHTVADDAFVTPLAAAPIAMASGIAVGTIVSASSPPLALVNMVVSIVAAILLAVSPLVPGGVVILSLVLFAYSVAGARSFIGTGRKRLRLEAQARKAQHFVDEF